MIAEIDALAKADDGLEAVVVGWPRRLDGSPTDQTPIVETFARALEGAGSRVPVILQDERLSSHRSRSAARARASATGASASSKLDAAAAAVILQDYLDSRPAGTCHERG